MCCILLKANGFGLSVFDLSQDHRNPALRKLGQDLFSLWIELYTISLQRMIDDRAGLVVLNPYRRFAIAVEAEERLRWRQTPSMRRSP
jgi:hypothetical protein